MYGFLVRTAGSLSCRLRSACAKQGREQGREHGAQLYILRSSGRKDGKERGIHRLLQKRGCGSRPERTGIVVMMATFSEAPTTSTSWHINDCVNSRLAAAGW